ncbi:MAG: hypothetical protein JKY81_01530 [Colwellia sp.]|nr:hypothetical protein [Colwellia sp.]
MTIGEELIEAAEQALAIARGEIEPSSVYHIYVQPKHPMHLRLVPKHPDPIDLKDFK